LQQFYYSVNGIYYYKSVIPADSFYLSGSPIFEQIIAIHQLYSQKQVMAAQQNLMTAVLKPGGVPFMVECPQSYLRVLLVYR
jgi:hypothetical protein